MKSTLVLICVVMWTSLSCAAETQVFPAAGPLSSTSPVGPVQTEQFHATFVKLGAEKMDGVLYEPETPGTNSRIALVYTFPRATFDAVPPSEMAKRGYRVLLVTPYTEDESPLDGVAETSGAIVYMRSLPGVQRVVVMGHSGGGRLMAFYANVALNGPSGCQQPELLYRCKSDEVTGLAKPDGVVLLDPSPGTINSAASVDPAFEGNKRTRSELDMYAAANGYDAKTGGANYSAGFIKQFYAAQSARNQQLIDSAVARLQLLEQGKGAFPDDEPLVILGMVNGGDAVRLYHTDLNIQSRTKRPRTLLKADGSMPEVIVHSVRPATGARDMRNIGSLGNASLNTTVRDFLANYALRTTKDFALTENDILGVDWKSSLRSTPLSAEGITVPTLVLSMNCYFFIVSDEIIFEHLAAKDKTFAVVEGAVHGFTPCKPEYGDTVKRTFDFVDRWLAKPERF